jgi:hypothetical protein
MAAPTKSCDVKIPLANPEPSTHGTSRQFAAAQHSVAYGAKQTLTRPVAKQIYECTP